MLTILGKLRNTVHGQAIQATMRQNGQLRDAPISLPAEHESQVLASMDNLGGRAAWVPSSWNSYSLRSCGC